MVNKDTAAFVKIKHPMFWELDQDKKPGCTGLCYYTKAGQSFNIALYRDMRQEIMTDFGYSYIVICCTHCAFW